jgi:hypothetical protein
MKIDRITASINPAAIYGGVYDPKFKPYAIYAERLLAAMLQADAKKLPRYQRNEERDTRAVVLAAMASFNGQEASFNNVRDRCKSVAESTLRKWLHRLAKEGVLIKGLVTGESIEIRTYKLPVVK